MQKYLSLIIYGTVLVLFVAFGIYGCSGYPAQKKLALTQAVEEKGYTEVTDDLMDKVQLPTKVEEQITGNAVADWFIPLSYVLVGFAMIAAIVLPLVYTVTQDPKSLVKIGISLGVLVVVFFICYAFADATAIKTTDEEMSAEGSKYIGGVLIMTYVMIAVAFVGAIFGEVSRSFK
ncbi:hypothetical protein Fleli_1498 [Bernardetia litoralis DSM 6794]|uniref:Uncharacterized protein n=1 Tax=Bernardetia litoralis (strain ATCC 23117 / DSM 6794 / NBRC 15988 / NCIMB 1366 / Fx l1 / Sio-4) TaxID=880071 RepID=I4AIY6_BERLS|nr:hypothetical protein [Bernardetia litoralis]AFM03921.1 hypothetical protein Fleli_1498 [Bernardetia litoralis DSM 6794]